MVVGCLNGEQSRDRLVGQEQGGYKGFSGYWTVLTDDLRLQCKRNLGPKCWHEEITWKTTLNQEVKDKHWHERWTNRMKLNIKKVKRTKLKPKLNLEDKNYNFSKI